jgi:putative flippase GtrA
MSETVVNSIESSPSSRWLRNPLNPPIHYLAQKYGGSKWKELERFLRFACVGVLGAILDIGTLTFLQATVLPPARNLVSPLVGMAGYEPGVQLAQALDVNVALATTVAFVIAVLNNFVWTSLWVYPDSRSRSMRRQLFQFAFISVVGWAGRTLWITLSYQLVGRLLSPIVVPFIHIVQPAFEMSIVTRNRFGTLVAQLVAMAVVMLWNFFANRYWTFNDVD